MLTFNQFVKKQYEINPYKELYGSLKVFKRFYIAQEGLGEWLQTLRRHTLTLSQVNYLVLALVQVNNVKFQEIPSALIAHARTHKFGLPVVFGLLTKEYWEAFFARRNNKSALGQGAKA